MLKNMSELTAETREKLKTSSKSLLRLHKTLLDYERGVYEKANGPISSPSELFRLVLDDPHFAWLRVLSGQIVVLDEFIASKQPTAEVDGLQLIEETRRLLVFEGENVYFAERLQLAIMNSSESVISYNESLGFLR
jgi:hypothetical protein